MLTIIGAIVVLVSVVGGYVLEKGNLHVLFQPVEVLIIFGAAAGAFIISSSGRVISLTLKDVAKLFSNKGKGKGDYLELLVLLFKLLSKIRKEGILSIENDIEQPEKSEIFNKHKGFMSEKEAFDFLRDNFRMIIMGVQPEQVDEMLEIDLEVLRKEAMIPAQGLTRVADALPGLGIVAAVLGVVITMGKINEPPEVLGHSIGAALVGTFLGILSSYGFAGPMATSLEFKVKEREVSLNVIKAAILHYDSAPSVAIEIARREIPGSTRPTIKEFDDVKNQWKGK